MKKSKAGDWLGGESDRLDGFKWSGGSNRVTTGIHIWPEVFKHDCVDGRKLAIILIDTQGIFDNKTTMKDNTAIFALSTLLSSMQIFNVMQNIQESDLHYLQMFSEYGRFAARNGIGTPFQRLMFLVRDWQNPDEFNFGSVGGVQYLKDYFSNPVGQEQEQKSIRNHINTCYANIDCFLMPFPGNKVSTNRNFGGNLKDIDDDFKKLLRSLVPGLLAPENLVVKKIGGRFVTCAAFLEYFKQYLEIFRGDGIPEPTTLMEANARAHNKSVLSKSKEHYAKCIKGLDTMLKESDEKLRNGHEVAKQGAYRLLERKLMGSPDTILKIKNELEDFIKTEFEQLRLKNSNKVSTEQILAGLGTVAGVAAAVGAGLAGALARR